MKTLYTSLFLLVTTLLCFGQNTDPNGYRPIPMPTVNGSVQPTGTEHHLVGYNLSNGTEFIVDTNLKEGWGNPKHSEPYVPENATVIDESVIGQKNFNDLTTVSNASVYPWSTYCKLYMTFPSGNYVGSGTLIGASYVITAGHCVYSTSDGAWANPLTVVPGYDNGSQPFGTVNASNLFSWTGWTSSADWNWDMGYIQLSQAVGNQAGWLGFGWNDDNFFQTNTFHNPGYPAESPYNGQQLYYWYGTYDQVWTDLLYFNKYCYGGQSGSGCYYKDGNNDRYVYAELSHYSSVNGTGHVRLTESKFNSIYGHVYGIGDQEAFDELNLLVYPNPATDVIHVSFTGWMKPYTITINDLTGKQLYQTITDGKESIIELPVSDLSPGFYTVVMNGDGNTAAQHFIKTSGR